MKVINLFGGPGSGKSTTAASLFAKMKLKQMRVELVTEFAKDLTYERNFITLSNQFAVTGQQDHRLRRLLDHNVDYVITDSPLPIGLLYAQGHFTEKWFTDAVLGAFNSYDNMNFLIRRVKPYTELGRLQNEGEANVLSDRVIALLKLCGIDYTTIDGDEKAASWILRKVIQRRLESF